MRRFMMILVVVLGISPAMSQSSEISPVSLIAYNGKIVTVDANFSTHQAIAVSGEYVVAVGSDQEILRLANEETHRVDLNGRTVLPGLIDTHVHFDRFTWELFSDDYPEVVQRFPIYMQDVEDRNGVLDQIKSTIERYQFEKGEWIFFILKGFNAARHGNLWYNELNRWKLDRVSPDNLIILPGGGFPDSGGELVNSLAIEELWDKFGMFVETYGRYWVDPSGQPTGILEPPANRLLMEQFRPRAKAEDLAPLVKQRVAHWVAMGVTAGSTRMLPEYAEAFRILEAAGELAVRVGYGIDQSNFPDLESAIPQQAGRIGEGSNEVWVTSMSLQSLDGSSTRECSQTERINAWPGQDWWPTGGCYLEPEYRGAREPGVSRKNYYGDHLKLMAEHGVRWANTHVAGDLVHKHALDLFEEIDRQRPGAIRSARWSMDHCRLVDPADIPRMAKLGLMMSCQPGAVGDGPRRARIYGEEVVHRFTAPIKSMMDAGVRVVFESDTRGNIWPELELFVTRKDDEGKVWGPHERVDRETVLKMITRWAAEYLLREDVLGSLEPGKLADLIVLDRDYMTIPEEAIGDIRVLLSFKGGGLTFIDSSVVNEYTALPRDGALVGTLEDF